MFYSKGAHVHSVMFSFFEKMSGEAFLYFLIYNLISRRMHIQIHMYIYRRVHVACAKDEKFSGVS